LRIVGAPLLVRPGAGLLVGLGAWRGWQETRGYTFVDPGSPLPDPAKAKTPEQLHALAEAYANWTPPHATAEIGLGWVLAAAVIGALVVVLSIVAHEVGHVGAMRAVGLRPVAIELNAFGGEARAERAERLRAGTLALVAAAGPAVTGLLALAAYLATNRLWTETPTELVIGTALWIALVFNAFALVVNLLPLRGLDGGQLLTAARLRLARG
jgi:Zn-dependent protease